MQEMNMASSAAKFTQDSIVESIKSMNLELLLDIGIRYPQVRLDQYSTEKKPNQSGILSLARDARIQA